MRFDGIRKQAVSEWVAWQHSEKPRIFVGTATCGRAAGAMAVLKAINKELSQRNIDAVVTQVGCIGLCYAEPLVDIIKPNRPRICYGSVTPEIIPQLVQDYIINDNPRPDLALGTIGEDSIDGIPRLFELPVLKPQMRIVLRNCGHIDPEDIRQYIANGGYSGLDKALEMSPEEIIEEVKKSGLRGRGGAAFPTGQKWEYCRQAPGKEKYLICNANEGDAGSFCDRTLLESDPHAILEGMLIAAYAIGATDGYIYIQAGYPLATQRFMLALEQAKEHGLLGDNILGSGFSFQIEIKRGAGAYICGEETALINSIEGKRGIPRIRPPFPAISGLWGKPTNVNNVETLANISAIIEKGGDWYASIGSGKSKGTKVFSISGNIARTGMVEIPFGMNLRRLVEEISGGVPNRRKLKALQLGGTTMDILPSNLIDQPISFESPIEIGSGVLLVIDEDNCMVDLTRYFLCFAQDEGCGKCIPCRVGTKQMLDILERITRGEGRSGDIEHLERLGEMIRATSMCGLGQTAPNLVLTTIRYFRDEYEEHINRHYCRTGVCRELSKTSLNNI